MPCMVQQKKLNKKQNVQESPAIAGTMFNRITKAGQQKK